MKLEHDQSNPNSLFHLKETFSRLYPHHRRHPDRNLVWLRTLARSQEMKVLNNHLQDENLTISAEIEALREEKILAPMTIPVSTPSESDDDADSYSSTGESVHVLASQIKEMQQQFKIALEKFKLQSKMLLDEREKTRDLQEQLMQLKAAAGELATLKEQLPKTLEAVKMQRDKIIQQQSQIGILGVDLDAEKRVTAALLAMLPEAARATAMANMESIRKGTTNQKAQMVQQQVQQRAATRSRGVSMLFGPTQ